MLPNDPAGAREWLRAVEAGIANLQRHLGIVGEFGVPAVVAVNRRPEDTDEEVELVKRLATEGGAFAAAVSDGFEPVTVPGPRSPGSVTVSSAASFTVALSALIDGWPLATVIVSVEGEVSPSPSVIV